MRMKPTDPSHAKLIRAVEAVRHTTRLEKRGNPKTVTALAIKIMTRDRNRINIPAPHKKNRAKVATGIGRT